MFYDYTLTIPPNTLITKPVTKIVTVSPGLVDRVMIIFPTGVAALAHIRILRGTHQVWPSNLDGDFASDGEFLDFSENYPLQDAPYEFILSGWNDDDSYTHKLIVRFNITPLERKSVPGLAERLRQALASGVGLILCQIEFIQVLYQIPLQF